MVQTGADSVPVATGALSRMSALNLTRSSGVKDRVRLPRASASADGQEALIQQLRAELEQVRAARSESEWRLIDALPVAIYTTDAEGRLTHFNAAAVEFSGRVPELGTDHWCVTWKLYRPDGTPLPHDECPMAISLKEGRPIRGAEAIAERPDGKRIWFTPYPTPLRDADDRIVGGINMLVDITERKEADEAKARLAAIVESSDDAIVSKDLNGVIRTWNEGAERLFGYTAAETIGQSVTMLIPPERLDEEPEILQRIRNGERVDHYETVRRRKDGTRIHVSLTVSPVKDSGGRVIGASKIARDISERKQSEAELTAAQEQLRLHATMLEEAVAERTFALRATVAELESFSYSISHDMRGPLRAMQGFAAILQEEAKGYLPAEYTHYLDRIYSAANRLDRLIQDVLKYSRVARAEIQLSPMNLNKIFQEIVQNYPALQSPNATIQIQGPLPTVLGHEACLTQCFSNLLGNAVKFVPKGVRPEVKVWSEPAGERVRIWVEDNGIGIAPRDQQRIFNIYERIYNDKQYDGTGIGLSIVRKTAERMGGSVGVQSELGKGSRFWVELRLP
jgi:PAS domain S-box-containing protein